MTTYNINSEVTIILTNYGAKILNAHWNRFNEDCIKLESYPFKLGDTCKIELWHLMAIFGPHLFNGNPDIPFQNNSLTISIPR